MSWMNPNQGATPGQAPPPAAAPMAAPPQQQQQPTDPSMIQKIMAMLGNPSPQALQATLANLFAQGQPRYLPPGATAAPGSPGGPGAPNVANAGGARAPMDFQPPFLGTPGGQPAAGGGNLGSLMSQLGQQQPAQPAQQQDPNQLAQMIQALQQFRTG